MRTKLKVKIEGEVGSGRTLLLNYILSIISRELTCIKRKTGEHSFEITCMTEQLKELTTHKE
jgi:Ni2+-binding GTPase involved in maturation of urease and hydrogenase